MKYSIIFTTIITLALSSQLVEASDITDTYTTGDTLTATTLDNIKAAVNSKLDDAPDVISSTHIATDAVGQSEIATNGVGSSEIVDGSVGAAEIASNAVTATDMQNEPGIKFSTSQSSYSFTLEWQTVETLTMVLPSSGYVNCTAQGFIINANDSANIYNIFGWDHNNTTPGVAPDIQNWSNQSGAGNRYSSISSMATYIVSAGTNTFSFKIMNQQGLDTDRDFSERGYVCMFFPTQY